MRTLGNVSLVLSGILYLVPLQMVLQEGAARRNDGGHFWAAAFVLAPLWLLAAGAIEAAAVRGALDWTGRGRGWQYAGVLAVCLALAVVTVFSYLGKVSTPGDMPWATRLFSGWAVYLFPPVTLLFALFSLNPELGSAVPPIAYRGPMVAVAVAGLLGAGGLALEGFVAMQAQQAQRVKEAIAREEQLDRADLERVQTLDPVQDFPELLGYTSRFKMPAIREIALQKTESRPDFTQALADALQNGWPESGMTYLDARELTAEQRAELAQPVIRGIEGLGIMTRNEIKSTHTFIPQQFDHKARLILSVVDKFSDQDVDYVPAVRAYRQTLDTEQTREVQLNARATLDAWLAKQK